jgi:D-sedoheptulose 7-phosphate isomerase
LRSSDADHIAGELLNKFRRRRALDPAIAARLPGELAEKLVGALPAISLTAMSAALSSISNDSCWEVAFAQQVCGLGRRGDALIAISTSGNSENCVNAALVARAMGMGVVALTGRDGGRLAPLADAAIRVPETETFRIQELHLPVYHALCADLEEALFA